LFKFLQIRSIVWRVRSKNEEKEHKGKLLSLSVIAQAEPGVSVISSKPQKWHEMCRQKHESGTKCATFLFVICVHIQLENEIPSRFSLYSCLDVRILFSYSMMSLSRKSAVRLFATYCAGRGNLFSPFFVV